MTHNQLGAGEGRAPLAPSQDEPQCLKYVTGDFKMTKLIGIYLKWLRWSQIAPAGGVKHLP